jgi:subtilisin family serine protease
MRLCVPACFFLFCALLCACGGGGGGGSAPSAAGVTVPQTTPTPSFTPTTSPALTTVGVTAGATATTATFGTIFNGFSGSVALPATTSGSGTANLTLDIANPNGGAGVSSSTRLPKSIGGTLTPLVYVSLASSVNLTFANWPTFTFVFPSGVTVAAGTNIYLAYNPGDAAGNWSTLAGPVALTGSTVTLAPAPGPVTFLAGTTYAFALITTGQVLVTATPSPAPTSTPTLPPVAGAFTCPTTGAASFARAPADGSAVEATRRTFRRTGTARVASATTLLAVTYARSNAVTNEAQIAAREKALNVKFVRSYDYDRLNTTIRVVAVPTASLAASQAALSAQPGVQSVGLTGARRYPTTVTTPFFTSDPYFQGFAANNKVLPYAESANIAGQWDMHAIGLEHAFAYSQNANGSGITNAAALGSSGISIAIIDTGADASHPELSGQIVYQRCFITSPDNSGQSRGTFSTDEDGHGTDVSGIAAAASNNAFGFTGVGGNTKIYAYRVFPTPDDSCLSESNSDDQCGAQTADIADAMADAVTQGVKIISMSLGGDSCVLPGVDPDLVERNAIANAIAHNVIVVAASGNGGIQRVQGVTAPGCDTGVIAVGATGLDDGQTTSTTGSYTSSLTGAASSANIVEYVTSYSQIGTPGANLRNASAWGIVAPGGDGAGGSDADALHWIENIWTTTPFDRNFAEICTTDAGSASGDCRVLISGTSMATPHVAGAAALILAVAPQYGTPGMMRQLLCSTADDLSDSHQGCGRLNIYRAMATALGDPTLP